MSKMVTIELEEWEKIVKKLQECLKANRALNKQIEEYNAYAETYNKKADEHESQ